MNTVVTSKEAILNVCRENRSNINGLPPLRYNQFPTNIQNRFFGSNNRIDSMKKGDEKYPGFFTMHSMNFMGKEKLSARGTKWKESPAPRTTAIMPNKRYCLFPLHFTIGFIKFLCVIKVSVWMLLTKS